MQRLYWSSFILFLLGLSQAQMDSGHQVSATLPVLLQLRYPGQVGEQVTIPVTATIHNGVYELTPSGSTLYIRSNTDWQLSASFEPHDTSTSLRFVAKLQRRWQRLKPYLTAFSAGQKTNNWQPLEIDYGLEAPLPPDGTYQGILTYTLIHP
jgi:hypothetical protein